MARGRIDPLSLPVVAHGQRVGQAAGRTIGAARAVAEEGIDRASHLPAGVAGTIASLAQLVRRTERPDR
ncbi:MAG TPA: hypothetical protein VFK38_00850, partial [Candidatus Limnocylindrales bacterium]|nr:hypothetical protein [Candidatus Limnocylindrales bacterium]